MGFTNLFKISRNRDVSDSTPPRDSTRSFSASNPPTPTKKSTNSSAQSFAVLATRITSPPQQNRLSQQRGPRLPGSDPREAGQLARGSAPQEDRNGGGMLGPRKGKRVESEESRPNGSVLHDRSPGRRRTGSLDEVESGLERLSFTPPRSDRVDARELLYSVEPLQPSRPTGHTRMHSNPATTRPTPLGNSEQDIQQLNPSPTRPTIVNKYSTSLYPQAYPTPPRPQPPPRSRGPDPFSTPHKSAVNTPVLPGAFPNSANNTPTPPPPSHPSGLKNRPTPPLPLPPLLPKRHSYQPLPVPIKRADQPALQTPPRPRPTSSLDTRRYSQIYGPQYSAPNSSSQRNQISPAFRNPPPFPASVTTPTKLKSDLSSTYRSTPPPVRPALPPSTHSLPLPQLPARRLLPIPITPDFSATSLVSLASSSPSPSCSPSPSRSRPNLTTKNQCQGTTASSKRCTRIVNEASSSTNSSPSPSPKKDLTLRVGSGSASGGGEREKMSVLSRNDLDELDEILGRAGEEGNEGSGFDGEPEHVARVRPFDFSFMSTNQ